MSDDFVHYKYNTPGICRGCGINLGDPPETPRHTTTIPGRWCGKCIDGDPPVYQKKWQIILDSYERLPTVPGYDTEGDPRIPEKNTFATIDAELHYRNLLLKKELARLNKEIAAVINERERFTKEIYHAEHLSFKSDDSVWCPWCGLELQKLDDRFFGENRNKQARECRNYACDYVYWGIMGG